MSMTQESSTYFGQVAGKWDHIRAGYFGEEVRKAAIAKAYLRPEYAVADIGAGTGFIAAGLAPLVARVYVVDGSAEMLEVARKNLAAFTNVEYHYADGLELPFPEESLDAVFANMYLHHCPDPLAALREMARVLRPGGRLVITDMDEHPYAWLKEEMADAWQGFDRGQVRAWLREAGLVNVIVDCTGQDCCATSEAASASSCCGSSTSSAAGNIEAKDLGGAKIGIFVAAGTRRMAMREAVRDSYGALAEGKQGCGCSGESSSCCGADSSHAASAGASCCSADSNTGASISASCCGDASSSCCSSSQAEVSIAPDYRVEDLTSAPQEAAEFSLGCGNPLAMAGLQPGEVVLDIGSGGGLDSFLAARRVGETGRVIGVDMTPPMLARARASAERAGISNVEFRQGYAEAMPVEDGTVDVVMSNCVINLTEDKGQVFGEAFRVLRPGGRLEVSDIVTSGAMPLEALEDRESWAECVSGALPEQEYLDLIAQAGFTGVEVRRRTFAGALAGVSIFSAIVKAVKPGGSSSG